MYPTSFKFNSNTAIPRHSNVTVPLCEHMRVLAGVTPFTPTFASEIQTDSSHSKLTALVSLCCFTDASPSIRIPYGIHITTYVHIRYFIAKWLCTKCKDSNTMFQDGGPQSQQKAIYAIIIN